MTTRRNNASGVSVFSSHTYTFDALSRRETAARGGATKWGGDYHNLTDPISSRAESVMLAPCRPHGTDIFGQCAVITSKNTTDKDTAWIK